MVNIYRMKFFLVFFIVFSIKAQDIVQIGMGPSYLYDIYFSFESGITAYPERTNWEISFSTNLNDGNIRINSGSPVILYEVAQNNKYWSQINSIPSNAVQLRNSSTDWNIGAFKNYNSQELDFSKIYIIDYPSGIKKIRINSFESGVFNFTYADLNGQNEQNINININDYQSKNFIYYSLSTNEILDREPNKDEWDILFTKYEEDLNNDINNPLYYYVSGVLSNENLTYEFNGPNDIIPLMTFEEFSYDINTIGYDWKEYTGVFSMIPDRSYFIFSQNQSTMYRIIFQSFSGQSSGNVEFSINEVESNIFSNEKIFDRNEISIFPNPSSGVFSVEYPDFYGQISLIDIGGKELFNKDFIGKIDFNLESINSGIYFLKVSSDDLHLTKKIIIE